LLSTDNEEAAICTPFIQRQSNTLLLDNNFQHQPTLESLWVFGLHVETQFELHYANQIAKRALSTKAKEINKGHKWQYLSQNTQQC
jgi:hypothetical protein